MRSIAETFNVFSSHSNDSKTFYFLPLDVCHTVQKIYKLPLKLIAHSFQQPSSGGQCKITLGANKPVVDPNTLFPGRRIDLKTME
jgi:hypothetical protein